MQMRMTRNRVRGLKTTEENLVTKVGVTTRSQRRALEDLTNRNPQVEVVSGKDDVAKKATTHRGSKRKAPEPSDVMDIPQDSPEKHLKKDDSRGSSVSMSNDIDMLEFEEADPWAGYLKCDLDTKSDPQHVVEYIRDIMDHLKETEGARMANPDYMTTKQTDVSDRMRSILIDWLVEVHLKFRLKPETLYLTINYIDRFLSVRDIQRSRLQLVGCTAMLLASKYEEIYAPEVRDFVYISDNAYNRQEILKMEDTIAQALNWDFTVPTMYNFAERYLKVAGNEERVNLTCNYLMEICLVNYGMLKYKPSMCASACVYLARKIIDKSRWSEEMIKETGYTSIELRRCVEELYGLLVTQNPRHKAVKKKYSSSKFGRVARLQVIG